MPATPQNKVAVSCPHCGYTQAEPRAAYSTVCKKCNRNYRVQEALKPARKVQERPKELKRVTCFQCGTELDVPMAAQSTMCKRCSSFVDLKDYRIDHSVTKNFKTKGRFVVEEKGFVFNTNSVVGDAVIKGKLHGKLIAEHSLEVHSTADIRGGFKTARLIVPAGNHFRWNEPLAVGSAEIAGELVADLRVAGTAWLRSTGRFFGEVRAQNFVVESGAVFVGIARIGPGRET